MGRGDSEGTGSAHGDPPVRRVGARAEAVHWAGPERAIDWTPLVRAGHTLGRWWALEIERRRLFNWLPVAMGIGVLLYFAADSEPALWAPLTGATMSLAGALAVRARPGVRAALVGLCFVFLGFAAGVIRTASVAGPVLDRQRFVALSGFVESVERRTTGARLVIRVTGFGDIPEGQRPIRVRVTTSATSVSAGDHVAGQARMLPPPGPSRVGGYDFARDAFFKRLGAVGSISGQVSLTPAPVALPWDLAFDARIDRARNLLTERIAQGIGGQAGAVAAALVTGKRGLITEETNEALRAAGIYHIVSISGLHMVLAAGTIFGLVRALLALSTTLALAWPLKKIAAVAAMIGATGYCLFSGSEVATERSLIMTLVMLGAILVDRPALSMRNLAIAALIVLAREPETLLGPSFQMSFGAVAGLIAFAERHRDQSPRPPAATLPERAGRWLWLACAGIGLTTLVASTATAPFGAYHFQTFNPFGLIGNALALPFVSLIVMPAAVLGALLYPFGLDMPLWWLMGWATQPVLQVADAVASLKGSTVVIAAFGPAALACLAAALLWLTLWTSPLRWGAVLPLGLGLALASAPERPDGYIDRNGAGLAVRGVDGSLVVLGRPSAFALGQWLTADGDGRKPNDPSLSAPARCDGDGCVLQRSGDEAVSFARTRAGLAEDCNRASLVVTPLSWTSPCEAILIDRRRLDRDGALTLRRTERGWETGPPGSSAARPWLPVRERPAAISAGAAGTTPAAPVSRAPASPVRTSPTSETEGGTDGAAGEDLRDQ